MFAEIKDKTTLEINDLRYKYMLELDLSDPFKYREIKQSIITKLAAMRQHNTNRNMSDVVVLTDEVSATGCGRAASRISGYVKTVQSGMVLICDQNTDAIGLYLSCKPKTTVLMIGPALYRLHDYVEALCFSQKVDHAVLNAAELLFKCTCTQTLPDLRKVTTLSPDLRLIAALHTARKYDHSAITSGVQFKSGSVYIR